MAFYIIMFLPVAVAFFSFVWLLISGVRLALIITLMSAVISTVVWGAVTWFFKDGLGPGFIPSTGITSLLRFAQLFAVPFAAFSTLSIVAVLVFQKKRRLVNA